MWYNHHHSRITSKEREGGKERESGKEGGRGKEGDSNGSYYLYITVYVHVHVIILFFTSRSLKQAYELEMLEEGEFDERVFLKGTETEEDELEELTEDNRER